jgi:hypothetical protein
LHPTRMSMPRICQDAHIPCQDILQHLLYSGSAGPMLHALILQCVTNLGNDYPTPGVRKALGRYLIPRESSLALLRATFFVLLSYDSRMRATLTERRLLPHLPPLCAFKACRFYDQLRDDVLAGWIKDETVGPAELMERLKESYLVA